ncbi:MAG: hypothetical protein ONB44_02470 [candidate division KSB1 bacterium]|nr:hypothetical protein [candidate division KSB1 bacterium]MDZ7300989.1 hypothetical protein [candidate division KSB1 bacterium]MDZ7310333.1 hypothetical protein [candidate division KSB1 bacterium]
MAKTMTLDGILDDLHAIEPLLVQFEKKYKLLSPYFYKLYQAGKLECEEDFQEWAALYEAKQHREQLFRQHLAEAISNMPLSKPVEIGEFS